MSRCRGIRPVFLILLATTAPLWTGIAARAQTTGVLHVRVSADVDGQPRPAPRHALLVSDEPPSRAPWRIVTAADGTGRVTLPPGSYVVESEAPLIVQGRAYEWRQTFEILAGQEARVDLTAATAEVSAPAPSAPGSAAPAAGTDAWDLLVTWEQSVVPIWTPTMYASAVVVAPGVLATAQAALGGATDVDVQVGATRRVMARVARADAERGVAILQVAPEALGTRAVLPLACGATPSTSPARGQSAAAISTPLRRAATTTPARISRLETHGLMATGDYPIASIGGPVFGADGRVIGLTTRDHGYPHDPEGEFGAASRQAVCEVLAAAREALGEAPPTPTPRPDDPPGLPEDAVREAATRRTGSLQPMRVSSSGFDVEFITPDVAFAGLQQAMDFGVWTRYVADRPAALLVRVTPRQVESLWMKVARGAALTQGIALPPITRFEPGFASMRVRCGDRMLTPVHPFIVERRVSPTTAVREGLYVFGLDAIGPHCGGVTFEILSEKARERAETATLDAKRLQQLWQDTATWRASGPAR